MSEAIKEESRVWPGIFLWTGEHATGKTTACLECGADPENIIFIDADVKGNKTVKNMIKIGRPFGKYINLAEMINNKDRLWQAYDSIWKILDDIPPNIEVVVIDPETEIYQVFRDYVRQCPEEFDDKKAWTKSRGSGFIFFEGKISRHAREAEQEFFNKLAQKVQAVHITAHLKNKYDGGAVIGKIPAVTKMIDRIASMICWLQFNKDSTTPIMLFVKPYGEKTYVASKGIRTQNITPRKAIPLEGEESVWDILRRYQKEPAHNRPPLPSEEITEEDRWIIEQVLSEHQRQAWFARLFDAQRRDEEAQKLIEQFDNPLNVRVKELQAEGIIAPPMIVEKLLKEIEDDILVGVDAKLVTIDSVAKLL